MSKQIAELPLSELGRLEIYLNSARKTLAAIRAETGADYVLNGGLYNPDWTPCPLLKSEGVVRSKTPWRVYGFGWNTPGDIALRADYENTENFLSCVCLRKNGANISLKDLNAALDGARQRSAMGLAGGKLVLYCTNEGTTPAALQEELARLGCTDAVMLDGGGSSQCDFDGKKITSSRVVQNLLLVYKNKKEAEKPVSEGKMVCLDPGHGPSTVNGSPDGSYKEKEFAWDMYQRIRPLLEKRGVTVIGTRTEDEMPSLSRRAQISNSAGADLFVSLHSNAAGNGGWYDARGFLVYTSAAGTSAGRNLAAAAIISRAHGAGVVLHGSGLAHEMYTVLAKTTAPAVLIEYGFHTNAEDVTLLKDPDYRDRLAKATAEGICDYLGIENKGEDTEEGVPNAADSWAAEAWEAAQKAGLLDGTRPRDALTRQELAVVLKRLNLI